MANNKPVIEPLILKALETGQAMGKLEICQKVGYPPNSVNKVLLRLIRSFRVIIVPTNAVIGRQNALCKYRLRSPSELGNDIPAIKFNLEKPTVSLRGFDEWGGISAQRDPLVAALFGPSKSNNSMAAS